jgi:hypothetical protein
MSPVIEELNVISEELRHLAQDDRLQHDQFNNVIQIRDQVEKLILMMR